MNFSRHYNTYVMQRKRWVNMTELDEANDILDFSYGQQIP